MHLAVGRIGFLSHRTVTSFFVHFLIGSQVPLSL
jgi:hypothetical protein